MTNKPSSYDLVLGGNAASSAPATGAVLGGISREVAGLNLRWSSGEPVPGDRIVKGYPVGLPFYSISLKVNYLLDHQGFLWSLEQKINEWMKPSIGYYNPEVFGTTNQVFLRFKDGTEYHGYQMNVQCHAVVKPHEKEEYTDSVGMRQKHSSHGYIESIALIVDEDELSLRCTNTAQDQWNHENPIHPHRPWREIPPPLSPVRQRWLSQLSEGHKVKIISPYHAKQTDTLGFLSSQVATIKRAGKRLILLAYLNEEMDFSLRLKHKNDEPINVSVSAVDGIAQGGRQRWWIEPITGHY